ncbi:hypothetical protein FALBO_10521 [Fusarium albosuccineum]|uniref:Uncharacterized protein n=1 Tax=Fusarium albosuccineum TaxID=1237068 RepID=A0A8H4PAY2_9HYPO|nr:hypothetical protein FALBO_10521 [Fusarium albosuccineum]
MIRRPISAILSPSLSHNQATLLPGLEAPYYAATQAVKDAPLRLSANQYTTTAAKFSGKYIMLKKRVTTKVKMRGEARIPYVGSGRLRRGNVRGEGRGPFI